MFPQKMKEHHQTHKEALREEKLPKSFRQKKILSEKLPTEFNNILKTSCTMIKLV
jgi:hypothetical protein